MDRHPVLLPSPASGHLSASQGAVGPSLQGLGARYSPSLRRKSPRQPVAWCVRSGDSLCPRKTVLWNLQTPRKDLAICLSALLSTLALPCNCPALAAPGGDLAVEGRQGGAEVWSIDQLIHWNVITSHNLSSLGCISCDMGYVRSPD